MIRSPLYGFGRALDDMAGNVDALLASSLEQALAGLGPNASKQRAVLLFDLAAAYAPHDAEQAAACVDDAFDAVSGDWYATAVERIPSVRSALAGTPFAGQFEDRASALSAPASGS